MYYYNIHNIKNTLKNIKPIIYYNFLSNSLDIKSKSFNIGNNKPLNKTYNNINMLIENVMAIIYWNIKIFVTILRIEQNKQNNKAIKATQINSK